MAINSNPGQTSTGGPSQLSRPNQPETVSHEKQGQNLDDFPHLKRWFEAIKARPATVRAYEKAKGVNPQFDAPMSEDAKKILFGQTATVLDR
jgi:GSH-dependent disulfide-bond oxidoreductase